jgi:gas vesicle protein
MGNKRSGLFFGVIVGTLLGVLFAPRKGKDLRNQLKKEIQEGGVGTETLKQNFTEMGHDMADTAGEVYNTPEVQKQVVKGKKHVDKLLRKAGEQMGGAEQKVKDLGEKYLDLNEEKVQRVGAKIQKASKNVQEKIQTIRHKFMGNMGFTKKPISTASKKSPHQPSGDPKSTGEHKSADEPKSTGNAAPHSKKPRTKSVKIKKQRG